ncbi:hypothetical protein FQR65_LT05992 [Abscondita terminalis]|nr:hypothetical protein FQR65_LT05992 [Abscondita terminalis]
MSIAHEHLSKNFFRGIVQNHFEDGALEIQNIDVSHVVPLGENYVCELLRVVIEFSRNRKDVQSMSVIIKRLLDHETIEALEEELGIFKYEAIFYDTILPIFNKLKVKKKICPGLHYLSTESKKMLVLEDLAALNYKMGNRLDGLDLDHCLLTIDKLAYFHASSLLIHQKTPEMIEQFNINVYDKSDLVKNLISISFREVVKTCQREPSLQKYVDTLNNNLLAKVYQSTNRDSKFNVLNHGDLWCNNLMYQYDKNGQLQDVVFVDFQLPVFASPCFDLHYFIATTANEDVLKNNTSTIFNHYYDSLSNYVTVLNVVAPLPSRDDFEKDFRDKAYMGMEAVCRAIPFCKADKRKDSSVVEFLENDGEGSFREHCFTNTNYLSTLKCLLSFFESLGLFEYVYSRRSTSRRLNNALSVQPLSGGPYSQRLQRTTTSANYCVKTTTNAEATIRLLEQFYPRSQGTKSVSYCLNQKIRLEGQLKICIDNFLRIIVEQLNAAVKPYASKTIKSIDALNDTRAIHNFIAKELVNSQFKMSITEYNFSKNCFKNIIQEQLNKDVVVLSVETSNALPAGQNFLCEVLRIVVNYSVNGCEDVHFQSFIAKLPIDSQYLFELEEQMGFFNCEMAFYNNIVPLLKKLDFILYKTDKVAPNFLLMNKRRSLKFIEEPSIMEKFCKGSMYKNVALEELIRVTFPEMLKTCQKHSSLQKYFDKMPKHFPEQFYSSAKPDPKFNVLNHGDFWCNNIMFKYNEDGQLENVLFVDFQVAVFASPVIDLHSFLATTPNLEVNKILKKKEFVSALLVNNSKIAPPKHKSSCFARLSTLTPLAKANKRKDASLTEFMENDKEGSFRHDCMNNPYYVNVIKCLLPYYETLGMFNS